MQDLTGRQFFADAVGVIRSCADTLAFIVDFNFTLDDLQVEIREGRIRQDNVDQHIFVHINAKGNNTGFDLLPAAVNQAGNRNALACIQRVVGVVVSQEHDPKDKQTCDDDACNAPLFSIHTCLYME